MITANFLNSSEVTTDRLFQWDIGQKIQLLNVGVSTAPKVHFCNKKSDNALVVTSTGSDGTYTAEIPNSLLAEEYDITAFIYVGSDTEAKTIKVIHIPVTKRAKPTSYVYTNNADVIDFVEVSTEIHSLLDGLIITPYDSTKSYVKPNIVYYQGQTYICKSEKPTLLPPDDDTKWGLMCKNGANIRTITYVDENLNFTLDDGSVISIPLLSAIVSGDSCEALVGYNNSNGTIEDRFTYTRATLASVTLTNTATVDISDNLTANKIPSSGIVFVTLGGYSEAPVVSPCIFVYGIKSTSCLMFVKNEYIKVELDFSTLTATLTRTATSPASLSLSFSLYVDKSII